LRAVDGWGVHEHEIRLRDRRRGRLSGRDYGVVARPSPEVAGLKVQVQKFDPYINVDPGR
jgi:hypothetical protein